MDLIYYRGLNCHLACIVNIAASLGVNYMDAFATLWSEADFTDEAEHNIYVSKRVFANLKAIGITIETPDCNEIKTDESMSRIADGEMFFIGMDTFDIPWHPVFGHFHDHHYFFAKKETGNAILCFDPVYGEKNIKTKASDIIPYAFELGRVYKTDASPPKNRARQEAKAVLRCHPRTAEQLSAEISKCADEGRSNIMLLLKQMNAMINNRYLFGHFFHNSAPVSEYHERFFNEAFFLKWEAVRNGLYKATIVRENKSVISEVSGLFVNLMQEEMAMAKEIISIAD